MCLDTQEGKNWHQMDGVRTYAPIHTYIRHHLLGSIRLAVLPILCDVFLERLPDLTLGIHYILTLLSYITWQNTLSSRTYGVDNPLLEVIDAHLN